MKKLLSFAIVLCLTLAMTVPAMASQIGGNPNLADNQNGLTDEATSPYTGPYDGASTIQNKDGGNESYGYILVEEDNPGSGTFVYTDDDDGDNVEDTDGGQIYIWAMISGENAGIYKIDIAWGAMKFEYNGGGQDWNPDTHMYDGTATGSGAWVETDYLDGKNNKIDVTNHSNRGITATFDYAMDDIGGKTAFNEVGNSDDAVVGNFFADNAKAVTAATVLEDTYESNNVKDDAVSDKLASKIWVSDTTYTEKDNAIDLPTAWHFNHGGSGATYDTGSGIYDNSSDRNGQTFSYNSEGNDIDNGPRTKSVYFAFSGTPDDIDSRGNPLGRFEKVGAITVTIIPNDDPTLNTKAVNES